MGIFCIYVDLCGGATGDFATESGVSVEVTI